MYNPWAKVSAVIVALLVAVLGVGAVFSVATPDIDEYGLHYSGGPFEGKHFEQLLPPGSGMKVLGLADYMVPLPANQRTYIVSENAGEGDVTGGDLITANDKEGVAIKFATSSTFELDSSPDKLNRFYLDICTKYDDCYDKEGTNTDGWGMMLNDYYRKAQESALQQVTQKYTVDQLMKQDRSEFQRQVAAATEQKVADNLGGKYFTDITFQIQRPIPPKDVQDKYNAAKAAELQTEVKVEEVNQAEQQALAAQELQKTLQNNPGYLELRRIEMYEKCVENGSCSIIPVPENSGTMINVQP